MIVMTNKNCLTTEKLESRTALRLPRQMQQQIDRLIEEGKFKTLSQVVRTALQEYLDTSN